MALPVFGLAVRDENRAVLDAGLIDAAEITLERADDPLRLAPYLDRDEFAYVSVHALKLSVASPEPPPREYLDLLAAVAAENGADAVSDHLGFTRAGAEGVEIGHFAPPPFTRPALDCTCRNVDLVQDRFPDRPFFLENITYQFRFEGTMTEAEFLRSVLRNTGCGWLLDVTNVFANATNFGYDAHEFIAEVMAEAPLLQMHLAGGFFHPQTGMYVDSHSRPVPEPVWDLYRYAAGLAGNRLEAVFIERDQDYPDDDGWLHEVNRARELAEFAGVR